MGALILIIGYIAIGEEISAWSVCVCVVGLIFLIGGSIAAPCCYGFDSEGVTFYYVFLPKERYLWKNIRNIKASKDGHSRSVIIDMVFSYVFEINGKVQGKHRFYMQGLMSRSFKTKRLLCKYWNKKISGMKLKK